MIDLQLLGGLAVANASNSPDAPKPRRRALALLALVASAAPQPISRDKLLALLWPESDSNRARNSLRQTIYALRRDLKEDLFLPESRNGLQLDPAHIRVDLWRFRAALAREAPAEAEAAYRGPFLDGFDLPGLSGFSQWVESERERIERQHVAAIDALAHVAEREERHEDAVAWRRRRADADPLSGRAALALLKALTASGDRGAALKYAAQHERLIRRELEIEPDPVVTEFVASLRREAEIGDATRLTPKSPARAVDAVPAVSDETETSELVPAAAPAPTHRNRAAKRVWAFTALAALLATGLAASWVTAVGQHASAIPSVIILASGSHPIGGRDRENRLVSCHGPACPQGALPQDAYVVAAHPSYAPPASGSEYIAPVPTAPHRMTRATRAARRRRSRRRFACRATPCPRRSR